MTQKLLEYYKGPLERVGFILKDGTIVEVENIADDPTTEFRVAGKDIAKYEKQATATWHTHPGASANLSMSDYDTFLNYPDLRHIIVGTNGVKEYYVKDEGVYLA